jgi:molecular chaperone DnaJ
VNVSGGDDLYGLLGVKPTATADDIADGFARLDRDPCADTVDAFEILRDPARRANYDDTRRARSDAATAAATSQHHAPGGRGDVELELNFDQAALGTTATVHVDTTTECSTCAGTGAALGAACDDCDGTGFHTRTSGGINIRTECRTCVGAGHAAPTPCTPCDGRGSVLATRAVTIRVPAGVADGARLRFNVPDGSSQTPRHAVVRVVPHPYFQREGNNLKIQVPITIAEAALGATITVPTLSGAVAIRIPPATRTGRTFRVRGRGIQATSGAGDLLATVEINIPKELTDEQRRALEDFAAASPSPRQHFTSSQISDSADATRA